jgi:hypothetical protein
LAGSLAAADISGSRELSKREEKRDPQESISDMVRVSRVWNRSTASALRGGRIDFET